MIYQSPVFYTNYDLTKEFPIVKIALLFSVIAIVLYVIFRKEEL